MPERRVKTIPYIPQQVPTALVLGHPGHELRVYGWAQATHPTTFVITDGSGTTGKSRLSTTTRILSQIGAKTGDIYGKFTDQGIYDAILSTDMKPFLEVVDSIVETLLEQRIEVVASDANEGYNPTHDLCCELTQAAVEIARKRSGRPIVRYAFCLTEWEHGAPHPSSDDAICVSLDDTVLAKKIEAARSYMELRDEVDKAIAFKGLEYFRKEHLLYTTGWASQGEDFKPGYEIWGERRVATGKYTQVLRYKDHVLPIFRALKEHVCRS